MQNELTNPLSKHIYDASAAEPDAKPAQPFASTQPDWNKFYAGLKASQRFDENARLDQDLDRFARSEEYGENDKTFDFLDTYCEKRYGVRPNRGNYFNDDRVEDTKLKPFENAERYMNTLMLVKRRGYEAIASDEYRAATKAESESAGDIRALAKALKIDTQRLGVDTDSMGPGIGMVLVEKTDAEVEEDVKYSLARIKGQNFLRMMDVVGYDFDDDDKKLIHAALVKGDGIPSEFEDHFASVIRDSPEKANRLLAMIDRSRKVESQWMTDNVIRPLWHDGIWGAAKRQAYAIADASSIVINADAFHEMVAGSTDSAKYYWNEAEKAEYARLVESAKYRSSIFSDSSDDAKAVAADDARRRVDWMCSRRIAKEAMPRADRIRERREQLLLEDVMGYKTTYGYNYASKAVAGAFSSVGYMATSVAGGGIGIGLNTLAQFQQVRDDVLTNGGDPDEAIGAQLLSAAIWSAIERLEVATAFGKPITGLQKKMMAARIWKTSWAEGRLAKIGQLVRAGSKELAVTTIAESVEEGLQGGIEGFTATALKTHDGKKAFDEALRRTGADFVESLGTMALIGGVGTAKKAVTSNSDAKSMESLADFAARRQNAVNIVTGKIATPDERTPENVKKALDGAMTIWKKHGGDAAAAVDEMRERYGLDETEVRNIGDYFDLQNTLLEVARKDGDAETAMNLAKFAGNAFKIGAPGQALDPQALYDLILPGTKVEEAEVPDLDATPVAPKMTAELAAAREAVATAEASVQAATVGSARRGAEKELRKAKKRLEKLESSAPVPVHPTKKVQKVTLATGESYILLREEASPDVHTETWAQAVGQAMAETFADPEAGANKKPEVDGRTLAPEAFAAKTSAEKMRVAVTKDQYLAMTPQERETYNETWDLKQGGSFNVLDEDGRKLLGSDGVVRIKRGFNRFVRQGGNWELAHEHGHFISAIAKKHMTPAQIAMMRKLFGAPTSDNESWNEENANNQFAEWLRGKYDFKVSSRAERRAKMDWFQRALDTVKHIFALSGEKAPVTPVEKAGRQAALDAAFNSLRNGDFKGLDAFAGIEFSEDKKEAEAPTSPDAQKRPSTPSEKKPGNEPSTDASRAPGAENAAPVPLSDIPADRIDEAVTQIGSNPGQFASSQPLRAGTKRTVFTPGYEMHVEAEAMWVPLADVLESTDDRDVQMRDRTRAATDEQVYSKTRKGVFQPLALFPGTKSDDGAPIVGGGLRIISGHGRKRMIEQLVKEGRFAEYIGPVNAEAARQGMPAAPEDMKHPVLVLRVTGGLDKREDLTRFAELSNRWGGLERSGAEHAESDAKAITDGLLRLYSPDASGNLLAASNRPFMHAFLKAVGASGLTNADGTPTAEAALRVQRALMTAIFGNDEKIRSMVQNLIERSGELSLASLQNALMRSAGRLLAMKRAKGSFDIVADVREASYQYIAWRSAQQKVPKLTLADHLNQSDFFSESVPAMQKALARLLDAGRFGTVLDKYNDLVAQQSVDAQSTFGFFEAMTPLQILSTAERSVLGDNEEPVTPDPTSDEAKAPVQTAPAVAVEPEPAAETEASTTPIEAAQAVIYPPEPAVFVPAPVVRGTATLPGKGASGIESYQVNAAGEPTTEKRKLPAGAWNLLRSPYDPRKAPAASVQDRAGRGLGITNPPAATDSNGRDWGDVFPHFQGNKTEMADRTSQAIRKNMPKAERDHYTTVVDYFGGGGCWGLYHALTNFGNARQLVVNEWEPGRITKIRLLHEHGAAVADEAEALIEAAGFKDEWREACKVGANGEETGSGATIANKLAQFMGKFKGDDLGLLTAVYDCAHTMLTNRTDVLTGAPSFSAGLAAILDNLREDGRKAKEAADAFKARGGKISYRQGDAASFADAPSGHQVVAVCDPPYYLTSGYNADGTPAGIVPLEGGGWSYKTTERLIKELVDKGDALVYTDEAWWHKESYTPDQQADFFSGGKTPFEREQETLLSIINTLDHFDVAGRVAGRQEVLGIHHGHDEGTGSGAVSDRDAHSVRETDAEPGRVADGLRSSVQRMAGGAAEEDRAILGPRSDRGRAGRVALSREVIVSDIAASIEEASPESDIAAVDALVRHSVRSVREDKMAAYAKTVSKNAKEWLERRTAELDRQMAEAGYTEKVWHGTEGEDFGVFKFTAKNHDVPAAYFTYKRETALSYAALRSEAVDDLDAAKPNLRQYYLNPGKCRIFTKEEASAPFQEFVEIVKKAYADGYNTAKVLDVHDDHGLSFNGDEVIENLSFFGDEGSREAPEGGFLTDIIIVMQQDGDNAPARIKAADPVTFWDEEHGELPIPLNMRANKDFPDLRFSVTMGKNAKEEARKAIEKYRPDLGQVQIESNDKWREWKNEYETSTGKKAQDDEYYDYPEFEEFLFAKRKDSIIAEIEKLPSVNERKAALYWFCKSTVRLPEDAPKITEALKTAERVKVDPMQFQRPGDILEQFAEYRPKEKPINPDTVPELTDRREMGHGIVTYLVQDDKAGQAAMRRIINTHFGKDASPWCLLQGDEDGNLTDDAWHYWNHYNSLPKRVAFKDGKLVAFMATDGGRGELMAGDIAREAVPSTYEEWWDRTDAPHDGIPFRTKDSEGRTLEQELLQNGETRTTKISKGDPKADGIYEEWDFAEDQKYHVVTERRNGVPYKTTNYWKNGNASAETFWPDRTKDDAEIHRTFNEDGTLQRITTNLADIRHSVSSRKDAVDFAKNGVLCGKTGNPTPLFHFVKGGRRFEDFDMSKSGPTMYGNAAYFFTNPKMAKNWGNFNGENRLVVEAYSDIKNPYVDSAAGYEPDGNLDMDRFTRATDEQFAEVVAKLEEMGWTVDGDYRYDGYSMVGGYKSGKPVYTNRGLAFLSNAIKKDGEKPSFGWAHSDAVKKALQSLGYDGVVGELEGYTQIAVFDNKNIRMVDDSSSGMKTDTPRLGPVSKDDWHSRAYDERASQGWTEHPDGVTADELNALSAIVPERHHTGSESHGSDVILAAVYPPNFKDTQAVQFIKQFKGDAGALSRVRNALYLIYGGHTNDRRRFEKMHLADMTNLLSVDKNANQRRHDELLAQEKDVLAKRQALQKNVGYPAYKDDAEWKRLNEEYESLRADRFSTPDDVTKRNEEIDRRNADWDASADRRFAEYRAERIAQGERELNAVADEFGVKRFGSDNPDVRFSVQTARETPQERHSLMVGIKGAERAQFAVGRLETALRILDDWEARRKGQATWFNPPTDAEFRNDVYQKTGWWMGTDGMWRVEIPDLKPMQKAGSSRGKFMVNGLHTNDGDYYCLLDEICSHESLFNLYPKVKNYFVRIVDPDKTEYAGMFDPTVNKITLTWNAVKWMRGEPSTVLTAGGLSILTHEIQHAVQEIENFARGGNNEYHGAKNYRRLAGEVEARNAEIRSFGVFENISAQTRGPFDTVMAPWETEDVPTLKQLIVDKDGKMTDMSGRRVRRQSVTRRRGVNRATLAAALVAQQNLAGKEVTAEDADKLLKSLGLLSVPAADVLAEARQLAETGRNETRRIVEDNAPELISHLARNGYALQMQKALDNAIAGGAAAADPTVGRKVQKAIQDQETRALMNAKGFDAALMMAELPIDLARGMLATIDREKTPEEIAKLELSRQKREEQKRLEEAARAEMSDDELLAGAEDASYAEPTDAEKAAFDQLMDRARYADEANRDEERRKKSEKAKRQAQAQADASGKDAEGGTGDALSIAELLPEDTVSRIAPVFDSPELFAQFVIEWTSDHVLKKHPELPSTAEMWKSPVAIRELKQTATHILRKLAKDALGSPSLNYARNFADKVINELESDADTRTFRSIRRKIAYIYDHIHEDALRMKRRDLVKHLIDGSRVKDPVTGETTAIPGIRQLAGAKGRFSAVQEEFARAIDAKTEQWARWLVPLLTMNEDQLAAEIARLEGIVHADPTAEDYRPASDDKIREAADRLALANKYGALVTKMPGEIADAAAEIMEHLNGRRQAFEARRAEWEAKCATLNQALIAAMEAGAPSTFRGEKWKATRWIESMEGDIALEMQNLVRFCPDADLRRAAMQAIDEMRVWISEGGSRHNTTLFDAQKELNAGLAACYGNAEAGIRHLVAETIPDDVARACFHQDPNRKPTYGQLLQMYASCVQRDYRENIEKSGRNQQLAMMEAALSPEDRRFHAWAVEWFKRNRKALSDSVEEVTGLPVTSPDDLYCPVRIEGDPDGIPAHVVAWSPVPGELNRRVRHGKDFNEGANFFYVLSKQCEIRARTIGYAMTGILLRDTVASRDVRKAAVKHVGAEDMARVVNHLRDILVQDSGGEDHFMDPVNVARKWAARFGISGNVSSMLAQPASIPVWANVTLGGRHIGLANVARYMATAGTEEGRQAIGELVEDMGFKARYDMGWSEEVQNILKHPSKNRVSRMVEKAYDKGMVLSRGMDKVCSLWIAQGFYRDATRHFLDKGETLDEAKRKARAITIAAVESTQQSGRTENLNALQRKEGAAGSLARAFFQFKTAQLLTNNYIIQSLRDVAARPGDKAAWGQLVRSIFIGGTLVPAYMAAKNALWALLMGDEPPEEDPDKWPEWFRELCFEMVSGVTAPIFFAQQVLETPLRDALGLRTYGRNSGMPAIDTVTRFVSTAKDVAVDAFDTENALHWDDVLADLDKLAKQAVAPYRHAKKAYDNRANP